MSQNPARPTPVSQFPAATSRSLDAWLNDSSVSADPQAILTRLQGLAFARAADISVGAAVLSLGITAIPICVFWSAAAAGPAPLIIFGVVAALLVVTGLLIIRRARSKLPNEKRARVIRGAGTARGGWFAAGGIWVVLALIILPTLPALAESQDGRFIGMIGLIVCLALLLVSCFAVPAMVLGRARESLRRVAVTDAAYRALLEQDRVTWCPQFGDQMYGPL